MLIRSQDKKNLIELQNINISICKYAHRSDNVGSYYYNIETNACKLGTYSTEEKAHAVLDMIEKEYLKPTYINDLGHYEHEKYEHKVFHIPEDGEVE